MMRPAVRRRWTAIIGWLAGVIVCGIIIGQTTFTTDLSAFLPQSPTKEQQVLLDQLRDGVVSRLVLIGIEGGDAPVRAVISKEMAKRLRAAPDFISINNGEPVNAERDQAFLFGNRYLLSPSVTPERFTSTGLHEAIGNTIDLLSSPAGMMIKPLLPRDPTGEIMQLLEQFNGGNRPQMFNGAWASRDGSRALLLAQTHAPGADIDAQEQATGQIQGAFDAALKQEDAQASGIKLVMTGPGVFAVLSRHTIQAEVTRLSIISTIIIATLLLLVYRSLIALTLGLLPVLSGALVGLVAVSLGFGVVHGITLGFGATLIGEAVDYSIYLFIQSRQSSMEKVPLSSAWISDFWPTIRLGVLTSVVGFSSLLLSSFPGLSQLGMYSIAGLIAAAAVTRFVLPHLLTDNFRIRDVSAIGQHLSRLVRRATTLRWTVVVIVLAACLILVQHRDTLWNSELSSLSPVSQVDQATDARLRADMGAPDVRYMVVVSGTDSDAVLQSVEKVGAQLQPLVEKGVLAGFESPSRYLPSNATQRARQAGLPSAELLRQRLTQAATGLPVQAKLFSPFLADVAAAKEHSLLQRSDLDNTSLAMAVDSLMYRRGTTWNAILPLTAPDVGLPSSSIAADEVRAALAAAGQPDALFVDLKAESDHLYSSYLREALSLSLAGLVGIAVLLLLALRSPVRVIRVMLPLVASVVTVAALLVLSGQRMTILHLVGLLLIVAVGSNYALFFDRQKSDAGGISPQTLTSLIFANMTTVAGFGLLGFSNVPVLQAIGATVGPGAVLALLFSAILADPEITVTGASEEK